MTRHVMLTAKECSLLESVFRRHPEIARVSLFGSRAKGTARPDSDIDLAVYGPTDDLSVEALAEELDELPLPYKYDVKGGGSICHSPLREHIERVGITIYETGKATSCECIPPSIRSG
ncbi:MAG: nucleotidyltransferase domain-containing protein [Patescibacteria group bacterium]|nr:nucleotidyltransferase domain-containing protein [Patescibacteria group bacterium]